jgi:hypothetical protein
LWTFLTCFLHSTIRLEQIGQSRGFLALPREESSTEWNGAGLDLAEHS